MFDPERIHWHYVNLGERSDRDVHARLEFARVELPVQRFPAYRAAQWTGDPRQVERMRRRTPGAIGCWMSQAAIIRTAVDSDRIVAVCEDDVVFCEDLQQRLAYIGQRCPADWDIFWLGGTFHCPARWHREDAIGRDVRCTADARILRTYGIWSTYAYLINGRSARRVLELLDAHMHESDGIDHCAILYLEPQLNTYCFVPGCAKQYDNESNIGRGVTQFSGFANLGPYWFQERMEQFDPATFDWKDAQ